MERRGKRESVIILVIMLIIAAVIVSWISGLWSCESGRKDLTEEEKLTISDYINSVSVLAQQSNKISYNFFNTLDMIKDLSREDLDNQLLGVIEESMVILENNKELNPPETFDVTHGYLELVFDTRNRAYENFKPALFNALDDMDMDIASTQITNTFLYMFMSDEIYLYFQEKLKEAGEGIGIENLIIIDSAVLLDRSLTSSQNVIGFISEIKTVTVLQERRGVAVIGDSVEFDPQPLNEQGEYWILANGTGLSVAITIENQGNIIENDVDVIMTYKTEDNIAEEKNYTISTINPSEQKVVTLSGFVAYPGRKCELTITAGPVPDEVLLTNNTITYKFMVEE